MFELLRDLPTDESSKSFGFENPQTGKESNIKWSKFKIPFDQKSSTFVETIQQITDDVQKGR